MEPDQHGPLPNHHQGMFRSTTDHTTTSTGPNGESILSVVEELSRSFDRVRGLEVDIARSEIHLMYAERMVKVADKAYRVSRYAFVGVMVLGLVMVVGQYMGMDRFWIGVMSQLALIVASVWVGIGIGQRIVFNEVDRARRSRMMIDNMVQKD